jgi:hypothetical protein
VPPSASKVLSSSSSTPVRKRLAGGDAAGVELCLPRDCKLPAPEPELEPALDTEAEMSLPEPLEPEVDEVEGLQRLHEHMPGRSEHSGN